MKKKNSKLKKIDFIKALNFYKIKNISFFYKKNIFLFKLFIFEAIPNKLFKFFKKKKYLNEKFILLNTKNYYKKKKQIFFFFILLKEINSFFKKNKFYEDFIILPILIKLFKCGLIY